MFYAIAGAAVFGLGAKFFCDAFKLDYRKGGPGMGEGDIIIMGSIVLGAGIGFGVGVMKWSLGTYMPWNW